MHFLNESREQLKLCMHKGSSRIFDFVPCGVVLLGPGATRYWNPAPEEFGERFDVRLYKPATVDEFIAHEEGVSLYAEVIVTKDHGLQSHTPNVKAVASLDDLLSLLTAAATRKIKVHAVGGGYAFSDVAWTDDIRLFTKPMHHVLPLDTEVLVKGTNAGNLRKVEAGISVEMLNNTLWSQGKALFNQGGFDQQSIVGALTTGTHGSGSTLGSLASSVRSMHLVTYNDKWAVRQVQIEPTQGITDRAAHTKKYPKIELIQDDDTFYSCTVSLGAMGIIYAVVMEVRDAYWLKEDRVKQPWSKTKGELIGGLAARHRHVEVLINPYRDSSVVTKRDEVKATGRSGSRNFMQTNLPKVSALTAAIQLMVNVTPADLPDMLETALDGTTDANVIDRCFDILSVGAVNLIPALASEIAIDATDMQKVVAAVDDVNQELQTWAKKSSRYVTSPYSLRFVKADKSLLSMHYGRDTCTFEAPMLDKTDRLDDTLRVIRDVLQNKHGGRPHWGQMLEIDGATAQRMYPKFDAFKRTYKQLNVSGAFSNRMTTRLGLDS